MTQEELEAQAIEMAGGEVEDLPSDELLRLITLAQYLFDRCLAAIEQRGELEFFDGQPMVPYDADHMVETILTRALN